jgi:integrase/recombinase XerD
MDYSEHAETDDVAVALQKLDTELKLRGLSPRTAKMYKFYNEKFLQFSKKRPEQITEDDVKSFIADKLSDGSSPKSVVLMKSALKFYYDDILNMGVVNIKTPKVARKLPTVLTRKEVKLLIDSANRKRHKIMIMLLYSSGLRVSELVNLRIGDLELDQKMGWVRSGKGAKDRMFIISEKLVGKLKTFVKDRPKDEFLFRGHKGKMTTRSVQKVIVNAAKRAGIDKKVTPHVLRHTFATHMLESGVDLRKIQMLLGHSQLSTTQLYLNVSNKELKKVKSPLDEL